jgi:hypothetical protein
MSVDHTRWLPVAPERLDHLAKLFYDDPMENLPLEQRMEIIKLALQGEQVEQHGLEQPRIDSMTLLEANEPVIVGLWPGGTHILIDGGHRRYFWAARNVVKLKGWAVPFEIWSQFIFDPTAAGVIAHHADGSLLPQRRK